MNEDLGILHVVLSLDVGGLERVVLDLIRGSRRLGIRADVACLERPGALAPEAEALGARVYCVGKRPGLRPGTVGRVGALLREAGPDVVHTHQIGALLYSGPAARAAGIPAVVHTEHGKHFAGHLRKRWLGRLAGRYADHFCCVSRDIADEVAAARIVPQRKVHVVPNGIDTGRFGSEESGADPAVRRALGIPPEAKVIGTIGRLNEIKRQDLLIRAFARLLERSPSAHLLLVGDGPRMGELRELAASLGCAEHVHFAGYQSEPEAYLQVMDVFALTSRSEGMPLVVLEAWAAGVPVVASRVGGLPELIDDERTGLLFPSGDEAALTVAVSGLLADPGRARRIGEAGRDLARSRYDVRAMVEDYGRHYREVLAMKGAPA